MPEKLKIIIVDDDVESALRVQELVGAFGEGYCEVLLSPEKLKTLIRVVTPELHPHIIISDLVMPPMSGVELWQDLVRRGVIESNRPDAPQEGAMFILMSSDLSEPVLDGSQTAAEFAAANHIPTWDKKDAPQKLIELVKSRMTGMAAE